MIILNVNIGHLAPVPYTKEAVKIFVRNITYSMRVSSSEMSETEFISRFLEETDKPNIVKSFGV